MRERASPTTGGSRGAGDFLHLLLERGGGPEGAGPPSTERAGDPQQAGAGRGEVGGGAGRRRCGAAGGGDGRPPEREALHLHGGWLRVVVVALPGGAAAGSGWGWGGFL